MGSSKSGKRARTAKVSINKNEKKEENEEPTAQVIKVNQKNSTALKMKSTTVVDDTSGDDTSHQDSGSESESVDDVLPLNQSKSMSDDDNGTEKEVDFALLEGVGENDSSDDSDHEANMETIALANLPTEVISTARNDEVALKQKLADVAIFTRDATTDHLPFWESLCVPMTLESPLSDKLALDDLTREQRFAELATAATHQGLALLRKNKTKFRRPGDYFAEMVKTDTHMQKIKSRLITEKEKIDKAQTRRNNRDISKNKRKIRSEQLERQQKKKQKANEEIEAFSQLRKQRLQKKLEKSGSDDEGDDFPIELLDVEQLDADNKFQKHKDIASGKKKAWKPQMQNGVSGNRSERNNMGRQDPKSTKGNFRGSQSGNGGQGPKRGAQTPKKNIKKTRGPKKRLGRSRRMATKK